MKRTVTTEDRLRRENERLRERVKQLEAEQREGARCVRALLETRKRAEEWLDALAPRKYLGL